MVDNRSSVSGGRAEKDLISTLCARSSRMLASCPTRPLSTHNVHFHETDLGPNFSGLLRATCKLLSPEGMSYGLKSRMMKRNLRRMGLSQEPCSPRHSYTGLDMDWFSSSNPRSHSRKGPSSPSLVLENASFRALVLDGNLRLAIAH